MAPASGVRTSIGVVLATVSTSKTHSLMSEIVRVKVGVIRALFLGDESPPVLNPGVDGAVEYSSGAGLAV